PFGLALCGAVRREGRTVHPHLGLAVDCRRGGLLATAGAEAYKEQNGCTQSTQSRHHVVLSVTQLGRTRGPDGSHWRVPREAESAPVELLVGPELEVEQPGTEVGQEALV